MISSERSGRSDTRWVSFPPESHDARKAASKPTRESTNITTTIIRRNKP